MRHFLQLLGKGCITVGTLCAVFGFWLSQPKTMWAGIAFVAFGSLYELLRIPVPAISAATKLLIFGMVMFALGSMAYITVSHYNVLERELAALMDERESLGSLRDELGAREQIIANREREAADKLEQANRSIAELNRDTSIVRLRAELEAKDKIAEEYHSRWSDAQTELAQLNDRLTSLNEENAALED